MNIKTNRSQNTWNSKTHRSLMHSTWNQRVFYCMTWCHHHHQHDHRRRHFKFDFRRKLSFPRNCFELCSTKMMWSTSLSSSSQMLFFNLQFWQLAMAMTCKKKIQIRFSFHSFEMQQALTFVQQIIQEKKSDSALDFDYCMNAM